MGTVEDSLGPVDSLVRQAAEAPVARPPPRLEAGTVVGGSFRVEKRLGSGGMGVVYLARDLRLARDVALKLHRGADEADGERVLDEAKVLARVKDPHVVTVYEVGTHEGLPFLAMEYVDGGTLRVWLAQGGRRWTQTLDLFLQAAYGLAAAHDAQLVHRDFKPDNVLIGRDGRARVADFGLARPSGEGRSADRSGTPAYMSPEQRRGDTVGARSDQYSFCLALREALPAGAPRWLRRVLERGLEEDAARRYPSMRALIERIEHGRRRRRRIAAVAAVIVALAAVGVSAIGWTTRRDPLAACRGPEHSLEGVWNDARRERVRATLAARCPSCRADTIVQALDRYAAGWTAARHDACAATQIERQAVTEARLVCLDRARAQLGASVDVLAEADADTARWAHGVAADLPPITRCDVEPLAARTAIPTDEARLAEARALGVEIGRASALLSLGRHEDALLVVEPLAARSRRLDYAPVTAEALYVLGRVRTELRDAPAAEQALDEAIAAAVAGGHDELAIRASSALGYLLAEHGRAAEGLRAASIAAPLLRRLDGDPDLELTVSGDHALMLSQAGRVPEALAAARRSVELARKRGGGRVVGIALSGLGVVESRGSDFAAAKLAFLEARERLSEELGPEHPLSLGAASNLGNVLYHLGEVQAARAVLEDVHRVETRLFPPGDPRLVPASINLAAVLRATGDHGGAIALYEGVLAIGDRAGGGTLAETLGNLAMVHAETGQLDRAHDLSLQSLAAFERSHPPGSGLLVNPRLVAGTLARYRGRVDEAARLHESAFSVAEAALPPDHADRVNARVELALTRLEQRRPADAIPLLEPAVESLARTGTLPPNLAEARFALARALWLAGGDRARSRSLAAEARDGYAGLGEVFAGQRQEIESWLQER